MGCELGRCVVPAAVLKEPVTMYSYKTIMQIGLGANRGSKGMGLGRLRERERDETMLSLQFDNCEVLKLYAR